MRRREYSVIAVVCLGVLVAAGRTAAQAPAVPLRQVAYLKASNPDAYDHFGEGGALPSHTGQTVAMSGDGNTIAIGAPHEASSATGLNGNQNDNGAYNGGAVYVYTRNGGTWQQQAYIKASNTGLEDWFAVRLAISGDGNTLAIGAANEDSAGQGINGRQNDDSALEAGAVYFFTRSAATWAQQAYVKGSNTEAFDEFGGTIALSRDGRTMVVGARGEDGSARGPNGNQSDNSIDESGAAYVFTR